jgi:hypothetical protein
MKNIRGFYTFLNEGKLGFIVLTILDRDEIKELNADPIVSEWIDAERVKIDKNELSVDSLDKEVLEYFEEHYGYTNDHF